MHKREEDLCGGDCWKRVGSNSPLLVVILILILNGVLPPCSLLIRDTIGKGALNVYCLAAAECSK